MSSRTEILAPEKVDRILTRIAYEIVERNKGASTLEIVGIRKKGSRLAEILASRIGEIESVRLHANDLDVSAYRDDRSGTESVDASRVESDMAGRDVILVDDVLFTGRTVRAALDAIVHFGRPRSIQLVVLIDRGHREFPIQPDYVGRKIPTKHRERVEVDVDGTLGVYINE